MKILAIIGSPRKGNSYKLTRLIEERLKNKGPIDFEYLFLKNTNLATCIGCHQCIKKGENSCPLSDDRDFILTRMKEADGVIFVSPVYMFTITALMKNFVDHLAFLVHRPVFFNKPAMIFIHRGDMFPDSIKYMERVVRSWGFSTVARLGIPDPDDLTPKSRKKSLKSLETETDKFFTALERGKLPSPSMYDLLSFRVWKINAQALKKDFPADYKYWEEHKLFDKDYYYDAPINPLKKVIARLLEPLVRLFMRRTFQGY
ncbi:MAG: NAD(P)H-dependent oxidoreductase [Methanobacteriaceae archaeon]